MAGHRDRFRRRGLAQRRQQPQRQQTYLRALATLPDILAAGGHLPAADGRLLAMKGVRPDDEIAALPPGWAVRDIHPLRVPGLDAERHLVVVGRTPPQGA